MSTPAPAPAALRLSSVVVYVDDGTVPDVLAFWVRAFGFEQRFFDPGYQFGELATGAVTVAVAAHAAGVAIMPGGYAPPPRGTPVAGAEIAFTTDDVRGAYARAIDAGATSVAAPYVLPWGQEVAYVRSVEGTIVGLCAPNPAAA